MAGLLNKSSCLAPTLGVTKFIIVTDMNWVTLCCATEVRLRCSTNPPLGLVQPSSLLETEAAPTSVKSGENYILHGLLSEGKGSVPLTSLHFQVHIILCFSF